MSPNTLPLFIGTALAGGMSYDQRACVRRYERQRYENAANRKQCARRRAKNKAARASRKRNRK
jgi:hypothetical protein